MLQVNPQLVPLHVATEFAGGEHATQEEVPQLPRLLLFAHVPAQAWKPALQVNPQFVPSQVVIEFGVVEHAVQSAPQLVTAVLLTQAPPHRWKPALHAPWTHEPATHVAVAFANEQPCPQVPQLATLALVLVSQPSTGIVLQSAKPALQASSAQVLAVQAAVAFANEQPCPQEAQFATLLVRSVSQPLTTLLSQSPRPAAQLDSVHTPALHEAPPPMNEQTFPQELQLFTLVCVLVSQPSAVIPLQLPNPPLQTAMAHVPPEHWGVALARTHTFGQLPQCVGSELTFTSQPSLASPLQSA